MTRLLRNHLAPYGVKVERPVLAATSMSPNGQRGGFVNWDAIKLDLKQQFKDDNDPDLRFTTLLDVYAMPKKVFQLAGFDESVGSKADVDAVEVAIEHDLGEPRFKAYLQRYELEALLLADIEALRQIFHRDQKGIAQLETDVSEFSNFENINGGKSTHPAARLETAISGYLDQKVSNAYHVLAVADWDVVRSRCPRFDAWLKHWEAWGSSSS